MITMICRTNDCYMLTPSEIATREADRRFKAMAEAWFTQAAENSWTMLLGSDPVATESSINDVIASMAAIKSLKTRREQRLDNEIAEEHYKLFVAPNLTEVLDNPSSWAVAASA